MVKLMEKGNKKGTAVVSGVTFTEAEVDIPAVLRGATELPTRLLDVADILVPVGLELIAVKSVVLRADVCSTVVRLNPCPCWGFDGLGVSDVTKGTVFPGIVLNSGYSTEVVGGDVSVSVAATV